MSASDAHRQSYSQKMPVCAKTPVDPCGAVQGHRTALNTPRCQVAVSILVGRLRRASIRAAIAAPMDAQCTVQFVVDKGGMGADHPLSPRPFAGRSTTNLDVGSWSWPAPITFTPLRYPRILRSIPATCASSLFRQAGNAPPPRVQTLEWRGSNQATTAHSSFPSDVNP
jgi:hypothetical protein